MIKHVLWDLDGVLYSNHKIHHIVLNEALSKYGYNISDRDHLHIYDGLTTRQKLLILSEREGLPIEYHRDILDIKQTLTESELLKVNKDQSLITLLQKITDLNVTNSIVTNSVQNTVNILTDRLGIANYITKIISGSSVINPKPHPEPYWRAMIELNALPEECIIVDDSTVGSLSAIRSGANFIPIRNRNELDSSRFQDQLFELIKTPNKYDYRDTAYYQKGINIVIPMAGDGVRFQKAGYKKIKPLIDINGKSMINRVIDNINMPNANYIFIIRNDHDVFNEVCNILKYKSGSIISLDYRTQGSVDTILKSSNLINNNLPLLIANCDQLIEWNAARTMHLFDIGDYDGGILLFKDYNPKWSYAELTDDNLVTKVAEKEVISNNATVGIYYWKYGSDFCKYAQQMINKNIRTNGEFYTCPVFNEALLDNKKILGIEIDKMIGLGTPEDFEKNINYLRQL